MTNFNISVVSDTVCPWCYIGKKKLDRAIVLHKSKYPNDIFSTEWRPYYLNPSAPKVGVDKRQMYASKFGPERAAMIFERLEAVGKEVGVNFRFGGKTGNTRDSHRVIEMAGQKGEQTQTKVVEALFAAYFENEQDITSHEVLKAAATESGIEAQEVDGWLKGNDGGDQVDKEVTEAQIHGISGVPNFTVQDQYEVGGAQDPEAFVQIFEKIKASEG
ncbi:MAG: hypothetical protein Q9191_005186 [Dirinaria sp. TL-2023a]